MLWGYIIMLEVKKYNKKDLNLWDTFVDTSKNGTIFNKQKFLSYHPKGRFDDCSLIFTHKDKVVGLFPAAVVKKGTSKILKSHPGSSYGGLIVDEKATLSLTLEMLSLLEEYACDIGVSSIEMRLNETIFHILPSQELDFALNYNGFSVENIELSSAVQLCFTDFTDLRKLYRSDTARSITKARKEGLTVSFDADLEEYYTLLCNNLEHKHRTTPTHSLEELLKLKSLFPEDIFLAGAFVNDELAAGTVVFKCNKVACHTFYIAQNYDFQKFRPLNLVFDALIVDLVEQGYRYLNFGISTEAGGTAINTGLFRFKEGFGARGVVRKYYKKELLDD